MVFIDQNRDMWIRAVAGKGPAVKLAAMVDCAVWHDSVGMLAFIADHKLVNLCCIHFCNSYSTLVPCPSLCLGLNLLMLHCLTISHVSQIPFAGMLRTDCSGGTRFVVHMPSAS